MACFADINVTQGSVTTYAMCGGIFSIQIYQGIFQLFFFKSAKIWQKYGHESMPPLFWPTLY